MPGGPPRLGIYVGRVDTPLAQRLFAIDTRALAAFRVGMGLLVLVDLLERRTLLVDLWGPGGLCPIDHVAMVMPIELTLYRLGDSPAFLAAMFGVTALAAALMTVGWKTRWTTALTAVLVLSLHARGPNMINVGDFVFGYLMAWCVVLPLGAYASLDARGAAPARAYSWATVGTLLQVAIVYFGPGLVKLTDADWRAGRAVQMALASDSYYRTDLGALLYQSPALTQAFTHGTLIIEVLGPLLLFVPRWTGHIRVGLVLAFIGFNAGLGASIELNYIPWILSLALIVFVPASLGHRPLPPLRPASRGEQRAGGALLVALLSINAVNLVAPDSLPRPLDRALHAVQWHQRWSMYVPPPPPLAFRLVFRGQTRSGTEVLVAIGARRPGWPTASAWGPTEQLWDDYRARIYIYGWVNAQPPEVEQQRLVDWFVRRWDAEHPPGEALAHIELVEERRQPWAPEEVAQRGDEVMRLISMRSLIRWSAAPPETAPTP